MKEVTILILDSTLLPKEDNTHNNHPLLPEWNNILSLILKQFLAQKIIDDPNGQYIGTIIHSHPITSNPLYEENSSTSSYNNINVTNPISPVNLDIINLEISSNNQEKQSKPLDTIIVAIDLLIKLQDFDDSDKKAKKSTKKIKKIPRKIIFFLASYTEIKVDTSLILDIKDKLLEEDIYLHIFDILSLNPSLKNIANQYTPSSNILEISSIISPPLRPKIPRLTSCFVGSLYIGGSNEEDSLISFPIKIYTKTSPAKLASSFFKRDRSSISHTNDLDVVDHPIFDMENCSNNDSNNNKTKIKVFRYGKIFIPSTSIPPPPQPSSPEQSSFNKKGIYVIGFIDKDPNPFYLIGFGYEIIPSFPSSQWIHLIMALRSGGGLKIVARQIQKDDGPPRLLLLTPSQSSSSLLMSILPFSNDLREFTFIDKGVTASTLSASVSSKTPPPSTPLPLVSDDQQYLMTKMIKEIAINSSKINIFGIRNPTFQNQMFSILNISQSSIQEKNIEYIESSPSFKEKVQLAFPPLRKKISNKWINEEERNWNTTGRTGGESKKMEEPSIERKTNKIVLRIGDENLMEKLNEMVSSPVEDLVITAMEQLMSIIAILACDEEGLNHSDDDLQNNLGTKKYKAIDLMRELRKIAISEDEPMPFNTFLMDLKNLPRNSGFPTKFWTSLMENNINLLYEGDCLNAPPRSVDSFY